MVLAFYDAVKAGAWQLARKDFFLAVGRGPQLSQGPRRADQIVNSLATTIFRKFLGSRTRDPSGRLAVYLPR